MNRDPALCRAFVARMKHALSSRPEIKHTWSIDGDEDQCILQILVAGAPGFDIDAHVFPEEIMLSAEGWHEHYPATGSVEDLVDEMTGRIRDMLSPVMRIREELSFGVAFRWHLENLIEGLWVSESTCGLFFYPWFGRKSEKTYSNNLLPPREAHMSA